MIASISSVLTKTKDQSITEIKSQNMSSSPCYEITFLGSSTAVSPRSDPVSNNIGVDFCKLRRVQRVSASIGKVQNIFLDSVLSIIAVYFSVLASQTIDPCES